MGQRARRYRRLFSIRISRSSRSLLWERNASRRRRSCKSWLLRSSVAGWPTAGLLLPAAPPADQQQRCKAQRQQRKSGRLRDVGKDGAAFIENAEGIVIELVYIDGQGMAAGGDTGQIERRQFGRLAADRVRNTPDITDGSAH